jgi:hypothetical protein
MAAYSRKLQSRLYLPVADGHGPTRKAPGAAAYAKVVRKLFLALRVVSLRMSCRFTAKDVFMKLIGERTMLKLVACIAVLGLATASASDAGGNGDPEWLFMQTADSASFADGKLVLEGVSRTVAFTDRPNREVAHLANNVFAAFWGEGAGGFTGDPPNAALAYEIEGVVGQAVVELTSIQAGDDSVAYTVEILAGEIPEQALGSSTLLIDGYTVSIPCSQYKIGSAAFGACILKNAGY